MSGTPTLTYFEGRGYGELIRMTLSATNVEFAESYITSRDSFLQLKKDGKLMFGQVPLLEIDGLKLVQRKAILRYLARRQNIYGKTDREQTLVDIYFEGTRDFMNGYDYLVFEDVDTILNQYKTKHFPRYLPVFEKILQENGTGYLVGDELTLADLALFEPLLTSHEYFGQDVLSEHPRLKEFYNMMCKKESIASFLSGPHRKPRNTPEHIEEVNTYLGFVVRQ